MSHASRCWASGCTWVNASSPDRQEGINNTALGPRFHATGWIGLSLIVRSGSWRNFKNISVRSSARSGAPYFSGSIPDTWVTVSSARARRRFRRHRPDAVAERGASKAVALVEGGGGLHRSHGRPRLSLPRPAMPQGIVSTHRSTEPNRGPDLARPRRPRDVRSTADDAIRLPARAHPTGSRRQALACAGPLTQPSVESPVRDGRHRDRMAAS